MAPIVFPSAVEPRSEIELLRRNLGVPKETMLARSVSVYSNGNEASSESSEDSAEVLDATSNAVALKTIRDFVFGRESSWVLDAGLAKFAGRVLASSPAPDRVKLLRLLAHCALKDGFQVLLFADRKDKAILQYLSKLSTLSSEEQIAAALFLCHLSSRAAGRDFLLYPSEWTCDSGNVTCNARISANVATLSMQSLNPAQRKYGVGLAFNLSLRDSDATFRTANPLVPTEIEEFEEKHKMLQVYKDLARDLHSTAEMLLKKNSLSDALKEQCTFASQRYSELAGIT